MSGSALAYVLDDLDVPSEKKSTAPAASALVAALETAWNAIGEKWEKLPPVVIVVAPVSANGKFAKFGHYAGLRWSADGTQRAEVLIAAEGLERGARGVFETLLHESVHAYQDAIEERGTSRQGRYHNKTFARRAEEFGLVVNAHPQIGHVTPDVTDECALAYREAISSIEDALRITRAIEPKGQGGSRNGISLVCGCERKLRVTESVAEEGPIICGKCGEEFLPEGSKSGNERRMPKDVDLVSLIAGALGVDDVDELRKAADR